ncbi:transporter substrate-binding domain-containing protein [Conchiformibius kuhniae]|uniref:Transporter substrate-binding domain-containing protein n=1 Tax=Conchiformibius kuhniae TaxID=211502 RepID=A0A8T9MV32_9NEIS|nr:transporter substrate-binding domain-containing protein [Conchiformibius kuhniae]UOP04974.1 transporter substrate-binding domain-containing protein [Conchiformibius kuhniae]
MNKMILPLLAGALYLAACAPPQPVAEAAPDASSAASEAALPVYTVATDATYPPFEFYDRQGNIIGLDIDLLNAVAERQGFKLRYYHHQWDGMFDQLKDKADIIASAVAITEESKQAAGLSNHYYNSPYMAVALNADTLKNWKQHTVSAARNEDTIEDLQQEYGVAERNIVPADTVYLSLTNLVKEKADVVVGDATVLEYYIHSPTFQAYRFHTKTLPSEHEETDRLAFAVAKGNDELLEKINQGLAQVRESGQLDDILHRWRQTRHAENRAP